MRPWDARHPASHFSAADSNAREPGQGLLERVPNPHADTLYVARFTRRSSRRSVPGDRPARFRPSRDRLRAERVARREQVAEALSRLVPQSRRLPRGLHGRHRQAPREPARATLSPRSAATGIRAAACRSTCSGRRASCPRASGSPIRASRRTAGAVEGTRSRYKTLREATQLLLHRRLAFRRASRPKRP